LYDKYQPLHLYQAQYLSVLRDHSGSSPRFTHDQLARPARDGSHWSLSSRRPLGRRSHRSRRPSALARLVDGRLRCQCLVRSIPQSAPIVLSHRQRARSLVRLRISRANARWSQCIVSSSLQSAAVFRARDLSVLDL
jgi:hypothetical protein